MSIWKQGTTSPYIIMGNWDADTNTPDISGAETKQAWIVSVAGATDLGGITNWTLGSIAIKTASGWARDHSAGASWGSVEGVLSDQTDLQDELDNKVDANVAIVGATHTKTTYDAKGLIVSGEDATKADVGLANVDNTSDADKPISTAAKLVLDGLDGNGVVSGMIMSINTDASKIDISSGTYHTHLNGDVVYAGETAVVLDNILTHNVTYLAIDSDGNVVQSTTPFTPVQRREYVFVGAAIHSNRLVVNTVNNLPDVAVSALSQLNDFMDGVGNFNLLGNKFSANGANLNINKSDGYIYKKGVGFTSETDNPHSINTIALVAPTNIRYRLNTGTEYTDTAVIDPNYYDLAGVRTELLPNKYTIQRITLFPSNLVRIQYGQAYYGSKADAVQAINTEVFITEQNIMENGLLRAILVVKSGTTNLSTIADAQFFDVDRWGSAQASASGRGTTTLQQAYSNSVTPEITTNTTLGALSVQCGSTLDTDNIYEGQNKAGAITSSIAGDGHTKLGDIAGGNYSEIEPDGILKFNGNATVWRDINLSGASLVPGGSAAPDPINFVDSNLLVYGFDGGTLTERLYGSCEMQHDYKEGSDIELHIHWTPTTADVGTVQWKVYYSWQNNAGAVFAPATLLTPTASNSGGVAWANNYTSVATVSGAGKTINSQLVFQIFRVPTEDTYTGDAALIQFGIHYQCDAIGSRQIGTK